MGASRDTMVQSREGINIEDYQGNHSSETPFNNSNAPGDMSLSSSAMRGATDGQTIMSRGGNILINDFL